jgi:hypothetical protein
MKDYLVDSFALPIYVPENQHPISYDLDSEEPSPSKIVHFCEEEKAVPSQPEANAKSEF